MTSYIVRRMLHGILVLLVVTFVVFGLMNLGGCPAELMAPDFFSEEDVNRLRESMGLDEPFLVRYLYFLRNAMRGDMGNSFMLRRPAMPALMNRVPATLTLAGLAALLAIVVSVVLGVMSAVHRGTFIDKAALVFALAGQSIPGFWFGILVIIIFAVQLRWLPSYGAGTWRHLVLPVFTLSLRYTGLQTRVIRSSMLEVIGEDYIRTARAKGLSERVILYKHALRNASLPVVTLLGIRLGRLVSGSLIIETVFAYPGVGWLTIQAIRAMDYPLVLSYILVLAVFILVANLIVDIMYGFLDPRIAYS